MNTPTTPGESSLSSGHEVEVRSLSLQFEAELRKAHERLGDVPENEALWHARWAVHNRLVLAHLLTSQNVLPMRLIALAPVAAHEHLRTWLEHAERRSLLPEGVLNSIKAAAQSLNSAALIAVQVAEVANMMAAATSVAVAETASPTDDAPQVIRKFGKLPLAQRQNKSEHDVIHHRMANALTAHYGTGEPEPFRDAGPQQRSLAARLIAPKAVRVELLVGAAAVFVLARTPTPIGEFLRAFSSWLLG